ncbi:[Fe-Fe] hydrogenase large subunit C-terminal domain-containing protein [Niameybacter massiliensis]|uniref:[Fe-Fe] hydrogenase large subunit C-terminal domain-containing protein n=1 Tax=Niameybacter massiliensis TaxID=1658108 RepID=UPI0006B668E6|nr:[Fe-Fe] hydrogenase large subunit C-terminal domain-containing protein [Niameybacter massiliensis]
MQVMNFSSTNCKNCYKCVRTCAVKAIEVKDDKAHIITERCVACGHCLVVCPQNARDVKSSLDQVKAALVEKKQVVVSLAPSYRAYFEESNKFIAGLRALGFNQIEETAVGAEVVSKAYEDYIQETEIKELITTCCPSTVRLIERYYSDLIPNMMPIVSPMIAHGRMIKEVSPEAYTVFIGPCISKICEALSEELDGDIDAVLTFDEIMHYFSEQGIDYKKLEPDEPNLVGTLRGSKYPVVGGVLNGIRKVIEDNHLEVLRVHGMENCKEILNDLRAGKLKNVCIEMNICGESCIAGPGGHNQEGSVFTRLSAIQKFMRKPVDQKSDVKYYNPKVSFLRNFKNKQVEIYTATKEQIHQVLESMGKVEKSDELNCGACGYETCRDKAIAVLHGMSQIDMCLPYTRSIAERLSNEIFYNSPNSILILDRHCKLIDMNPSSEQRFGYKGDLMKGKSISIMMDPKPFEEVLRTKTSSNKEKVEFTTYDFIAYRHIIYLEKQKALLVIFADITDEEKRKKEVLSLKESTLDVTQSIIDKQMRVAQEIASLLGETTAETKVAIMKLRKVLNEEGDR